MSDVLLITPPFTQLNTPYPATAYLKGFLNTKDITSYQVDLGIEVILCIFSEVSLECLFDDVDTDTIVSENAQRIYSLRQLYCRTIDSIIEFLQGKQPTLARKICSQNYLPQASRFDQLQELDWAFGTMGLLDKAKHLATLYLEDISDFIIECVDPYFGFSRYAERLGRSANSFDELYDRLLDKPTYIDDFTTIILEEKLQEQQPKLVCFSVPFPGNLYSAFRCAQYIKANHPSIKIAMGGGFANTELRSLKDVRVFEFFDYITLDDGELPIELLISNVLNPNSSNPDIQLFKRTFLLENNSVVYNNHSLRSDYKQADVGTPDYSDLLIDEYISVIEIANPMHSLWSDGRWNKLTMAHGCYWGKCTFCDISLDYINNYEPVAAKQLVDRMEKLIDQTDEAGFHFVDEAAPPSLMREVALEIIRRDLAVSWWTNIRFEKSFTKDLCVLLKRSGCIAVSGGLEVASDRLLKLIDKGVTVEQVAHVNRNFTEAGILVHSYLMYGYPTQTIQETIDSLEMVRQLFECGVMQSGFWHQFALTAHSPIGLKPEAFGLKPNYAEITFANNDIDFTDSTGIDHNQFSYGLKKSLFNYMNGQCIDWHLQEWFDFEIPETTIAADFIECCLSNRQQKIPKPSSKLVWIGYEPTIQTTKETIEQEVYEFLILEFHTANNTIEITLEKSFGEWLLEELERANIYREEQYTFGELKLSFNDEFEDFESFWQSEQMTLLKGELLLVL